MAERGPITDVALIVEGKRYSGWKSIRVTRSIESLTGSFALEATDRWGDDLAWPIVEGDACRVEVEGQTAIDGYVDDVNPRGSAEERGVSLGGNDKAVDLVDCSLLVADATTKGNKWTYRNVDIAQFAAEVAKPHGVKVSVQPGLKLKKDPLLVAHVGETGFEAIKRAAGSAGVLVVSDGAGGIVITRAGKTRATPLDERVNIKSASGKNSSRERFYRYRLTSTPPGTDEVNGEALQVQAEAIDVGVRRRNRVLLIRPDKGMDTATARSRADWEARMRAAKASTVTIAVVGWTQPNGALWTINEITRVRAPRLIGIDGDMLISQVEFSVGDDGKVTQLQLVRPDAFTPEPQNVAKVGGESGWKELVKGGL